MKTKKLLLIALSVLACAALCAVLYFAFVSPPGENRLAGARFVKADAYGTRRRYAPLLHPPSAGADCPRRHGLTQR